MSHSSSAAALEGPARDSPSSPTRGPPLGPGVYPIPGCWDQLPGPATGPRQLAAFWTCPTDVVLFNLVQWLRNQGHVDPAGHLGLCDPAMTLAEFSLGTLAPRVRHWFIPPEPGPGAGTDHEGDVQALWSLMGAYPRTMAAFRLHAAWDLPFMPHSRDRPAKPLARTLESLRGEKPALIRGALVAFQAQVALARDTCACVLGDEVAGGVPAALARAMAVAWDEAASRAIEELDLRIQAPLPELGGDLVPPLAGAVFARIWHLHVYGAPPRPFPALPVARPGAWGAGGAGGGGGESDGDAGGVPRFAGLSVPSRAGAPVARVHTIAPVASLALVAASGPRAVVMLDSAGVPLRGDDGQLVATRTRAGGAKRRARRELAAQLLAEGESFAYLTSTTTGAL